MKKPTAKKTKKTTAKPAKAHKWDEVKYSRFAVNDLIEQVKAFNCGAIDMFLSEHVDEVFKVWLKKNK